MFLSSAFSTLLVFASVSSAFGATVPHSFAKRDNGCAAFPNGVKDQADPFGLKAQYDDTKAEVRLDIATFGTGDDVQSAVLGPVSDTVVVL